MGHHAAHSSHGNEKIQPDKVRVGGIVIALVGLTVLIAGALLICWLSFCFMKNLNSKQDAQLPSMMETDIAPPEPRLQVAPVEDLAEVRKAEHKVLSSYAWVNKEAGIARVPVERAMQMLAEKNSVKQETAS